MNELRLSGSLAAVEAARTTPAGVPVVQLRIEHESVQDEAGHSRQVKAQIKSVAFGSTAERIRSVALGQAIEVRGFLANAKKSPHPVLHIQDFQVLVTLADASPETIVDTLLL